MSVSNSLDSQDGNLPRLTKKERELLDLLAGNPGRCFSRGYLLRTIWGYSDATRTRTVDVHVSRLRKKLEGRPDVAIHTVVRQGYVLERRSGAPSRSPKLSIFERGAGAGRVNLSAFV